MTQLDMVNRILRRLRENEVTTVIETDYAKLIATFVNDAKADVEDVNHTWSAYETEIDVAIDAIGTQEYDLTGTNDRSFLLRDRDEDRIPLAYDVTSGEAGQLFDCPLKELRKFEALNDPDTDSPNPRIFAVQADNDIGDGWKIRLAQGSTTARTWRMYWYVPQAELEIDGSADNTVILLPNRPIELKAIYYALNERGEEMGEPGGIAFNRAMDSLGAALETDMQVQKKSDEIDITNMECLGNSVWNNQ